MVNIITAGDLSLPVIRFLLYNRVRVSVFTDEESMANSTGMLVAFCQHAHIPVKTAAHEQLYDWLNSSGAIATFIIGYSHLIDISRISKQQLQYCYNIHFGSLPDYRGANPVFWQIKNGSKDLAVTIHRINEKFDDGPVAWSKNIKREDYYTFGLTNSILSNVCVHGISYILESIKAKRIMPVSEQPKYVKSKYYRKPGLQDVLIDWDNMHIDEIALLVQACNPWNKGAITIFKGQEIKILDVVEVPTIPSEDIRRPGTIVNSDQALDVYCREGKTLRISMLNIDGTFVPGRHAVFFGLNKGQQFAPGIAVPQ